MIAKNMTNHDSEDFYISARSLFLRLWCSLEDAIAGVDSKVVIELISS